MLARWTELLPLFVVRWMARRWCERVTTSHTERPSLVMAMARPDVLFVTERRKEPTK